MAIIRIFDIRQISIKTYSAILIRALLLLLQLKPYFFTVYVFQYQFCAHFQFEKQAIVIIMLESRPYS